MRAHAAPGPVTSSAHGFDFFVANIGYNLQVWDFRQLLQVCSSGIVTPDQADYGDFLSAE